MHRAAQGAGRCAVLIHNLPGGGRGGGARPCSTNCAKWADPGALGALACGCVWWGESGASLRLYHLLQGETVGFCWLCFTKREEC